MKKTDLFRLGCSTIFSIAMVSVSSGISGSAYAQRYAYTPEGQQPDVSGVLGSVGVINRAIDDAFNQPGGNLVASPKTDKPCYLSDLLAGKSSCEVVGGPWVRAMGGQTTTSTAVLVTTPWGVGEGTTRQRVNFSGVQVGADSGWLNLEGIGVNAHVGVTGGNVSADASSGDLYFANRMNFEVPFLGAYYVLTKGNLMTDFSYRHSWYIMKMTDVGLSNAPLNGQSDNINASVSYKFALPDRYFIEPMANISYTRSTFDSLGGYGVMDFAPATSLLGRAGLRFGTSFSFGGYNWSPYVLGLVENEFEKSSKATLSYGPADVDVYAMSTDRVGTFYQTSLGIAFQSQTSGLVGFARGDWQIGHNINGGGVVGGLRYTFGPGSAMAADLRTPVYTKASAMMPAGLYDWSGFHIGLNGGYGSSRNCWDLGSWNDPQPEGCHNTTGGTFGGQIGYRWQAANWVFGLEGQGNWADFKGQNTSLVFDNINQTKIESFGLVTGQVGRAWNNVLLYVKGGAAVVNSKHDILELDHTPFASANDTRWGGTVGAGLEVGVAQNWSLGVEYNHIFLGDRDNMFITPDGRMAEGRDRISQDVDMALVRLNYNFGGGAR